MNGRGRTMLLPPDLAVPKSLKAVLLIIFSRDTTNE
jgi:hypothetical protein